MSNAHVWEAKIKELRKLQEDSLTDCKLCPPLIPCNEACKVWQENERYKNAIASLRKWKEQADSADSI